MSNAHVIEIGEETAGLVGRDGAGFRFFSATSRFGGLDGSLFPNVRDAHLAVSRHLQERPRRHRAA
ncbi:hypothetical protein [Phreatobacter stygius]|uniref:Uncharacterized protein n=1 Tax=Phreatobacter stygius TaxID=1940610 RepID=A0A4D7BAA9_9HYPH|nr:hypothetical protein [Phreatobacter stygius]QCI65007.1 hypothetical protein E8M01_12725 [Phreatobacter stygius]